VPLTAFTSSRRRRDLDLGDARHVEDRAAAEDDLAVRSEAVGDPAVPRAGVSDGRRRVDGAGEARAGQGDRVAADADERDVPAVGGDGRDRAAADVQRLAVGADRARPCASVVDAGDPDLLADAMPVPLTLSERLTVPPVAVPSAAVTRCRARGCGSSARSSR
jgi:hypothetical protein